MCKTACQNKCALFIQNADMGTLEAMQKKENVSDCIQKKVTQEIERRSFAAGGEEVCGHGTVTAPAGVGIHPDFV